MYGVCANDFLALYLLRENIIPCGTSFTIFGNTVKGIQYPDSFSDQTGEIYRQVQVGDTLFKEINEFDIVVKKGTGAIRFPYYYEGYYYWGKRLELHPDTPCIIVPKLK